MEFILQNFRFFREKEFEPFAQRACVSAVCGTTPVHSTLFELFRGAMASSYRVNAAECMRSAWYPVHGAECMVLGAWYRESSR